MSDPSIADLILQEQEQEASTIASLEEMLLRGRAEEAARVAMRYGLWRELPTILWRVWSKDQMTPEELALALPEVWIINRGPLTCLGQRRWLQMFKAAGFLSRVVSVVGEPERADIQLYGAPPREPLTVWRGASLSHNGRGMSWSLQRDWALTFAQAAADEQGTAGLYAANIPPRAVLAMFGDGSEQEVVVNPDYLRRRIVCAEVVTESAEHITVRTSPSVRLRTDAYSGPSNRGCASRSLPQHQADSRFWRRGLRGPSVVGDHWTRTHSLLGHKDTSLPLPYNIVRLRGNLRRRDVVPLAALAQRQTSHGWANRRGRSEGQSHTVRRVVCTERAATGNSS